VDALWTTSLGPVENGRRAVEKCPLIATEAVEALWKTGFDPVDGLWKRCAGAA
jgi:hypothetical protein